MQCTDLARLKAIARVSILGTAAKKSQYFSFASFIVKTGFSEQVIQSSISGRHGYNLNQLIENGENVTLPFEMISIIFMPICNATPKMSRGGFQCLLKGNGI